VSEIRITGQAVRKDDGTWESTALVALSIGVPRELVFAIPGVFKDESGAISAGLHYGIAWVDQELRP
jgi:hypothetical protein